MTLVSKLRKYGNVYEKLMYGDTCTISRHEEQVIDGENYNDDSTLVPIYENVKCKFSFDKFDDPKNVETYNPDDRKETVHMQLDYDVRQGDFIEGYRIDAKSGVRQYISGYADEPNRYDSHQEIEIFKRKEA